MKRVDFLKLIDELADKDPGTLQGSEILEDEGWDSLSVISFIALVAEHFKFNIPGPSVVRCTTVNDLVSLVEIHLDSV